MQWELINPSVNQYRKKQFEYSVWHAKATTLAQIAFAFS